MKAGPRTAIDSSQFSFKSHTTGAPRFARFCRAVCHCPEGKGALKPLRRRPWQMELVGSAPYCPYLTRGSVWACLPLRLGKPFERSRSNGGSGIAHFACRGYVPTAATRLGFPVPGAGRLRIGPSAGNRLTKSGASRIVMAWPSVSTGLDGPAGCTSGIGGGPTGTTTPSAAMVGSSSSASTAARSETSRRWGWARARLADKEPVPRPPRPPAPPDASRH